MKDDVAAAEPGQAVHARPAASLIVVQHQDGETRLLMARRHANHRFMPNVLVFPGGAVDEADHHAPVASPLRADVRARLERGASPALAHALAVAAARELTEEVGLSLGEPPALACLDYLCRAITPPDRSMRFDARFFVVAASEVSGVMAASRELEDPGWYTLEEAFAGELAAATRAVLGLFRDWTKREGADVKVPVFRDRKLVEE
jgi:8-oxo-dGTP pyrophosphatase MutT (NUDIX family)